MSDAPQAGGPKKLGPWPGYTKVEPWHKRFPEKVKAQRAVQHAVRTGKIKKPKRCQECRSPHRDDVVGHHDDYSQPLKVRWLCGQCHSNAHKNDRFPNGKSPWGEARRAGALKRRRPMTAADLGLEEATQPRRRSAR